MDSLSPELDLLPSVGHAPGHDALAVFCRRLGDIVAAGPMTEVPCRIAAALQPVLAIPDLLTPEQRAVPARGYARNDLFICPSGHFSVLAVVWPAGIVSPIHDHKTWCAFGVYEGTIRETRYEPACADAEGEDTAARILSSVDLGAGDVAHLPIDAADIHCMHNPGTEPAVSIHVYGGDADVLGPNVKRIYACES